MSAADGALGSVMPTFHKDFNSTDTDITVISSDNTGFRLHSKFVHIHNAHGLQIMIADAGDSELVLEEPSSILKILFPFLYPRRSPSVVGLDFKTLIQLAEAAEKYKIFNAAGACEHPLVVQVASYPAELLSFGLKHDYPELTNRAAMHLSRVQKPLDEILDEIPENARVAWVRYDQQWKLVFKYGRRYLNESLNCYSCGVRCPAILNCWLEEIEAMPIATLRDQKGLSPKWMGALKLCKHCASDEYRVNACSKKMLELLLDRTTRIPMFMAYMNAQTRGVQAREIKQLAEFTIEPFPAVLQFAMHATRLGPI